MFQTTVKDAVIIPGVGFLHITGTKSVGSICVGDFVSDGISQYKIVATPLINRTCDVPRADEIDICIDSFQANPKDLVGKTLWTLQK